MKRLLALLLALIMVCTLLPMAAFADDSDIVITAYDGVKTSFSKGEDKSGSNWSWSAGNATLTLNGFKGQTIAAKGDLKIVLRGANTLSVPSNAKSGISTTGKLTIDKYSSSQSDTLTVTQKSSATSSNLIVTGSNNSTVINGGTVKVESGVTVGTGKGIYSKVEVNKDAALSVTAPYFGVSPSLKANTSGAVSVTVTGEKAGSVAVPALNAQGAGTVTLSAAGAGTTTSDALTVGSGAGTVNLKGYTKVSDSDSFSIAANKKVQGVENYFEGYKASGPSGQQSGYYLVDSSGAPIKDASYATLSPNPLAIMDSPILDVTGLAVSTRYESHVGLLGATRGGDGSYTYKIISGTLPKGLSLDANTGKISGTPTAAGEAGTVTVQVTSGSETATVKLNYSSVKAGSEFLYLNYGGDTVSKQSLASDGSGAGWSYEAKTKTLTLNNYSSGPIKCDTSLKIVLKGTNKITIPNSSVEGISVNGKLTIDKTDSSLTDSLTVTQTSYSTSANLVVTGGSGSSKAFVVNGGTVNLSTSEGAIKNSAVKYSAEVNNDANLNITSSYRGVGEKLTANTTGSVAITSYGKVSQAAAAVELTAQGTGPVSLTAEGYAKTVSKSLTVRDTAGVVSLKGYTSVSETPYKSFDIAHNKTIENEDGYYFGYWTSAGSLGNAYYLTDSNGKPLTKATIVASDAASPVIVDSKLFDIPAMKVGTKVSRNIYIKNATYGGEGEYTFSLKEGSTLPAGLTLNEQTGFIGGTPTKSAPAGSFVVVVTDAKGNTAEVTVNYAKIAAGELTAPVVSTGNDPATGKNRLTWKPVDGAAKYEVYRSGYKNGTYSLYFTTTGTGYTNSSSSAGYTYYYKVRAVGADGVFGPYCEPVNRTCDLPRPVLTSGNNATSGKITLSWPAIDGAKSYTIYRAGTVDGTYSKMYTTTSTSYTNTSSVAGRSYYYKVVANSSRSSYADSAATLIGPLTCRCQTPVVTLSNDPATGKVIVSWGEVAGAGSYEVYRSGYKNGTYTRISLTDDGIDTAPKAGYTYYYKVKAVVPDNEAADSALSTPANRTVDCAAPVIAKREGSTLPSMTWAMVDGAQSYTVYRATTRNGEYSKMYTTKSTSYTNTSAQVGKTYYYKIVANSERSEYATSAYSNVLFFTVR